MFFFFFFLRNSKLSFTLVRGIKKSLLWKPCGTLFPIPSSGFWLFSFGSRLINHVLAAPHAFHPAQPVRTYVHMYVCTSLSIPVYVTSVTWLAHLSRELPSSYSIASPPDDTTILNLFSLREWGLLQLLLAFIYLAVVMSNTRHKSSSAGPPSRFGRPFSSFLPPISRLSGWRKSFASLFFFFLQRYLAPTAHNARSVKHQLSVAGNTKAHLFDESKIGLEAKLCSGEWVG